MEEPSSDNLPASNSEQAGEGGKEQQPSGGEEPVSIKEGSASDSKVEVNETVGKETGESSNGATAAAENKPDPEGGNGGTAGAAEGKPGRPEGENQPASREEVETSSDSNQAVESKVTTPPPSANGAKDDDVTQSSGAPNTDQVTPPSAETTSGHHGEVTETAEPASKPSGTTDPLAGGGSDINEHPSRPETLEVGGASGSSSGENPTLSSSTRARKERKSRKKSRRSVEGTVVPGLRRRSSKVESRSRLSASTTGGASGHKHLEIVILSVFHPYDPEGTGYVNEATFWDLLQSPKLNLQLSYEELAHLQSLILPDQAGMIPYAEFASQATDIMASLYTNQPPSEAHWVDLTTEDGSVAIILNKQTGEVMDKAESGIDAFAGVIDELYKKTDSEEKGYVTWKMFSQLLQSAEMSPYLGEQDIKDMKKLFSSVPNGKASYDDFCPLAKDMILRVYRARDPSDNPWCKLNIPEVGEVWFNKFTGDTHRGLQTGDSREHEIAFINQAYAQVEEITFELEQHKQLNRDLENQLAKSAEDQETLEAQLYETGNALDEANNEVLRWESEVNQMRGMVATKDQEMDLLRLKLADMDGLKQRIAEMEQELQKARDTIANRDSSITERDTNIMSLQRQADAVTDELKTAHGEKDAQDSALSKLKHQLQVEQKKVKEYEKCVPELESELSSTKEQLESTKRSLDEKTAALVQSRKHLKNARERGLVLEKDMEKLEQTQDKLSSAESEIRTLKTFLTTKTALIEKHKKELRETRLKVAELEEKDARRAVILADVLEKTARQYQQQIGHSPLSGRGSPKLRRYQVAESQTAYLDEPRPYSAPAVPPEGTQGAEETDFHPASPRQGVVKSFTTQSTGPMLTRFRTQGGVSQGHTRGSRAGTKVKNRSRSVPKLPPITRGAPKQQRAKSFVFPTSNDLRYENKIRDAMDIDHTPSNPQCACQLCRMNSTVVGSASNRRPETGLTGMTAKTAGLPGYQGETDVRELALAEQLHIGQRVLVRMKKSEFDIEPTQLTGIIKYVGKVDREYVDHRIYVGVKLDEAAGDTDGLFKQKRYFTCPPKHGKLVRITSVVAVLPPKSVFYKSLQEISKRSPYTTVQKKLSMQA